mgnify:CR=1 FL=1
MGGEANLQAAAVDAAGETAAGAAVGAGVGVGAGAGARGGLHAWSAMDEPVQGTVMLHLDAAVVERRGGRPRTSLLIESESYPR